jgi:hypothetical protein
MTKPSKKTSIQHEEKKTAGDAAHAVVKTGLSMIPVLGGPAAELFAFLIGDPASKRREEWMEKIAQRLEELEQITGEPIAEKLKNDESFVTTLMNASQLAIRNHQHEKIDALANAVMNAALGKFPDDTERSIMLNLIDRLTPSHLAVLALMRDPRKNAAAMQRAANISMGGLGLVIFAAFPALAGRKSLVELIWKDLIAAGLLGEVNLNVTMSGSGLLDRRTTEFGNAFLDFITDPVRRE